MVTFTLTELHILTPLLIISPTQVDYYGAMTPLKAIAGISAPDSRSVVVQPYDTSAMAAIEKAIMKSDLGITPSNDGRIIRINIPALTAVSRALWA